MANSGSTVNFETDATDDAVDAAASESPVTERARKGAHEAVDKAADRAAAAERSFRRTADVSAEKLGENQERLKTQFDESISKARQMARENPLATAGLAFAAGVLFSAWLRR
ncbi:DUF883 domain-containing protein [Exilibacterium tricleocarpae]|uniref:DUF883 domain-containing protein n=1 Tax=Exilibacterium tricleocarpae TaxID=2591008 RepID=A0A545SXI7_9GAMM|nr:DUF883 domain-containing protein [Exilibacterium tricleocarpae]TQV69685.1 DUF883 domain-containing protein [Exilibacterium tricleocarpae]